MSQGKLQQVQQAAQSGNMAQALTAVAPQSSSQSGGQMSGQTTTNVAPVQNINQPDTTMNGTTTPGGTSAQDMMAAMGKGLAQAATVVPPQINQQAASVAPQQEFTVSPVTPTMVGDLGQMSNNFQDATKAPPPQPITPPQAQSASTPPQPVAAQARQMPQPVSPGVRPNETYQQYQQRMRPQQPQSPFAKAAAGDTMSLNPEVQMQLIQTINNSQYKNEIRNTLNPATGQVDNKKLLDLYNKAAGGSPVVPQQGATWVNPRMM